MSQNVLIVDDDQTFRDRLVNSFKKKGFNARSAGNAQDAILVCQDFIPDLAVVDLKMPGESGLNLIESLHGKFPGTKILMLTGYGTISTAVQAVKLGAYNFLQKPATLDMILNALSTQEAPKHISFPSLTHVEWEHIQRALSDCQGNITKAAKSLGLHRRSLQRKLMKIPPRP